MTSDDQHIWLKIECLLVLFQRMVSRIEQPHSIIPSLHNMHVGNCSLPLFTVLHIHDWPEIEIKRICQTMPRTVSMHVKTMKGCVHKVSIYVNYKYVDYTIFKRRK